MGWEGLGSWRPARDRAVLPLIYGRLFCLTACLDYCFGILNVTVCTFKRRGEDPTLYITCLATNLADLVNLSSLCSLFSCLDVVQ